MKIEDIPVSCDPADIKSRPATLSGMFYPGSAQELKSTLDAFFSSTVTPVTSPYGVLVPHAGYLYSGKTAACAYAKIPETFSGTFIVIGPSHPGCMTATADLLWETPLGPVCSDTALIASLQECGIPNRPDLLRVQENSLEVQMPFIRYSFPNVRVAQVLLGDQSVSAVSAVADAVCLAIDLCSGEVVIIASGDGSHYVPRSVAEHDDLTVLAAAARLDTEKFYEAHAEIRPSMCGYGCIAALRLIGKHLGATEARMIMYQTSDDATGDRRDVVGYAAMEVV